MVATAAQGAARGHGRRSSLLALLLCCWAASAAVAAGQPTAAAPPQQQNATTAGARQQQPQPQPPKPEDTFPLIVVFKDKKSMSKLRLMCNNSALMYRASARGLGLPMDCHMPGQCKRIYSTAVTGFAGDFTNADLLKLERCLPGSIFYKELDGTVHKAEDGAFWHSVDNEGAGQQRRVQEPGPRRQSWLGRRMQQQVQDLPRVESFEERTTAPTTEDGPINLWDLTQGRNMNLPGQKQQVLTSRLWNLDRLDQRELPLNGLYSYGTPFGNGTGEGATIYVVDSGIKRDHQEFKNDLGTRIRASYGRDFVDDDDIADDCDGHGTHVSATAVGLQVGVAKEANVVAVRILDCTGSGTISDTVAGLDWVAANHRKPAVVTLSLGIQVGSWSRVLEDAVRNLARMHNVTVVVASGNSGVDACYVAPANVPEVITVAASNLATKYNGTRAGDAEDMYRWANSGPCVDVFAPGVDIYSACGGQSRCQVVDNKSYTYASGTSMAVPHVAGVAAIYLSVNPGATPQQVSEMITLTATPNKVSSQRFKAGTPNRLLYSRLNQEEGTVMAANGPRP